MDDCDHGQLYANFTVTFRIPVEHNSAKEMERAHQLVSSRCSDLIFNIDETVTVDG
jgi:hypothetical protein